VSEESTSICSDSTDLGDIDRRQNGGRTNTNTRYDPRGVESTQIATAEGLSKTARNVDNREANHRPLATEHLGQLHTSQTSKDSASSGNGHNPALRIRIFSIGLVIDVESLLENRHRDKRCNVACLPPLAKLGFAWERWRCLPSSKPFATPEKLHMQVQNMSHQLKISLGLSLMAAWVVLTSDCFAILMLFSWVNAMAMGKRSFRSDCCCQPLGTAAG
jgi:hypothetical protein